MCAPGKSKMSQRFCTSKRTRLAMGTQFVQAWSCSPPIKLEDSLNFTVIKINKDINKGYQLISVGYCFSTANKTHNMINAKS